jgi:hypothetical protein
MLPKEAIMTVNFIVTVEAFILDSMPVPVCKRKEDLLLQAGVRLIPVRRKNMKNQPLVVTQFTGARRYCRVWRESLIFFLLLIHVLHFLSMRLLRYKSGRHLLSGNHYCQVH